MALICVYIIYVCIVNLYFSGSLRESESESGGRYTLAKYVSLVTFSRSLTHWTSSSGVHIQSSLMS